MSCPMCQNKTAKEYRPFCSKRCADLDLGRWLTGAYKVESEEPLDGVEDAPSAPPLQH